MGRAVLAIGAGVWLVAGLAGMAVALAGLDRLVELLPPLAIDDEALRGAIVAVSLALLAAAAVHVAVLTALRRQVRVAPSVAILLAATALAVFVALAATAFASAAAEPSSAALLVGAGVAALVVAGGYLVATVAFVREIRTRGRSGGRS